MARHPEPNHSIFTTHEPIDPIFWIGIKSGWLTAESFSTSLFNFNESMIDDMRGAILFIFIPIARGFLIADSICVLNHAAQHTKQSAKYMVQDFHSLLTAVEVFDGSAIVDPVVVSNVFWANLKGKIIAVILGQILAAVVFALLSSLVASQISLLGNFVSKYLFPAGDSSERKKFIKATDVRPTLDFGKLLLCLAIDVIGSSSEIVPLVGELTDAVYAPIAATALRSLFGGSNVIFALEFAEEILPFTDILPLATLW